MYSIEYLRIFIAGGLKYKKNGDEIAIAVLENLKETNSPEFS